MTAMINKTQLDRYKKLLAFIGENFKDNINIPKIEEVCHYSYRNINRIFEALHQETIGKYVKRLRLEKAAQYLKYSDTPVSDIAFEVGFEERASFNKAFKKKYGCSPSSFRSYSESQREITQQSILQEEGADREKLKFEIEYLPDFEFIFLEHRGDYEDFLAIEATGNQVYNYALKKEILVPNSIFMTEIMDDSVISDSIHLRYNLGFVLERPLHFEPEGLYRIKKHKRQKYAKFIHKGSYQESSDFYNKVYAFWMWDIGLDLEDLPTLEFYPNMGMESLPKEIITEIYIPIK